MITSTRSLRRLAVAALILCLGCQTSPQSHQALSSSAEPPPLAIDHGPAAQSIQLVALQEPAADAEPEPGDTAVPARPDSGVTLEHLERLALENNPTLRRMQQEAAAAWDRARYAGKLPDPTLGSTFFVPPMAFEPDRQIGEVQLTQMIPWLARLDAEAQRACLEALVAENQYQAERLRVTGDLRTAWFKLYVLGKQIEKTEADQAQLQSLIKTANARVATGDAQPGDVLMATLEFSSLQEQLISYRQQIAATTADLNRLAGREAGVPIESPALIDPEFPDWDHALLRRTAFESQPELNAARLRTAATRWGIEVARLKRRPDLTFGLGWVIMDAPGATEPEAGRDSLMLGVTTTLPIWDAKYDAMLSEATHEHFAAHASVDEVANRLDAVLRDLWEQARASRETVELYEESILPQARQAFQADQQSLVNNTVTFERVIRSYRTLLNLELGYHRALGQQATALARIRQTIGVDL